VAVLPTVPSPAVVSVVVQLIAADSAAVLQPLVGGLSAATLLQPLVDVAASTPIQTTVSDWAFVWENRWYLLSGAGLTVTLTITSLLVGFLAGFPAGVIETYGEGRLASVVTAAGVVLRGTPIVVILIVAFFVLPTPDLRLFALEVSGGFVAGTLGLGLRSAAYQSQIFRGALRSVDDGQLEAARAVGMSRLEAIRHVAVPQALRRSVPGFQNEVTIVLKDTSVVFAIGLSELLTRSYDLFVRQTTAVLEVILFASLIYFVLTFGTNRALDYAERRFSIPEGNA
jgi:polar amino acid transport system permease protein